MSHKSASDEQEMSMLVSCLCNPFILSQSCNLRVRPLSVCNGPFGMHQCVRVAVLQT